MKLRSLIPALLIVATAAQVDAQCADGSPPPCPTRRVASAPVPIDPNRVAILPFRVTTSDTLLGEGFAELLAAEFTGEGMPRAVDMGTTLGAWHRAGGRPRTPLTRARAIEVARSLGAGLVSDGSIVTLGNRITISAALLHVPSGRAHGNSARVTVSVDSLDYALRQVTAILGAKAAGPATVVVTADARYTSSPEALRDYLEGIALWRRGKRADAARAWDRAIARDSLFAHALYRRHFAQLWGVPSAVSAAQLLAVRDRLPPSERAVMRATYGDSVSDNRDAATYVSEIERLVILAPDNADMLYTAGDAWYHFGSTVDPARHLQRALAYFTRAMAVDSQANVLQHILEVAHRVRDTAVIRQATEAYARTDAESRWHLSWLAAAALGDERWLQRLRREEPDSAHVAGVYVIVTTASLPPPLVAEMFERWTARAGGAAPVIRTSYAQRLMLRGRPAAADSLTAPLPPGRRRGMDVTALTVLLAGGKVADPEGLLRRIRADTGNPQLNAVRRCLITAYDLRSGRQVDVDTTGFERVPMCGRAVQLLRAMRAGVPPDSMLNRLDSELRRRSTLSNIIGFESLTLAEAWVMAGQPARALAALRQRVYGFTGGVSDYPWLYPEEGRLAEQLGDKAGAIRAYRLWLDMMRDAEPMYDEQRAAVRAALARLERGIS